MAGPGSYHPGHPPVQFADSDLDDASMEGNLHRDSDRERDNRATLFAIAEGAERARRARVSQSAGSPFDDGSRARGRDPFGMSRNEPVGRNRRNRRSPWDEEGFGGQEAMMSGAFGGRRGRNPNPFDVNTNGRGPGGRRGRGLFDDNEPEIMRPGPRGGLGNFGGGAFNHRGPFNHREHFNNGGPFDNIGTQGRRGRRNRGLFDTDDASIMPRSGAFGFLENIGRRERGGSRRNRGRFDSDDDDDFCECCSDCDDRDFSDDSSDCVCY